MFYDGNRKFEKHMKTLMKKIDSNKPLENLSQYDLRVLEECINRGYVSNIDILRDAAGVIFTEEFICDGVIEKSGYEFLYPKIEIVPIVTMIASLFTAVGVFKTELISLILWIAKSV